ncbi:MAG: choice-of-anchor B family protein [Bacteroidia bacterium]
MKQIVTILFALSLSLSAFSQELPKNLRALSKTTFDVDLNDVWGYVDGNGVEYAIVGRWDGVSIFSLADPANPLEVADIPGQVSVWRDMKTFGTFAYVSHDEMRGGPSPGDGTLIIDLSDLPNSVTYKDTVMNGVEFAHNVYIADSVLYSIGNNNRDEGLAMFDLRNDPWNPEYMGGYREFYVHDAYVRNNLAYTGEISDGQLSVIDVTDKANPVRLGTVTYPGAFTHNTWLNDASDVCFSTDELDKAYIYAWDVRDPMAMAPLDRIRSSLSAGRATPHNVHVLNDYLITSYYKDGIQIVDASRPHNLIEVGHFDTSPMEGGGTDGCWGAYPFLPSGLILATDIQEGFYVLGPDYIRGAYLEGKVTNASTGANINQAEITLDAPVNISESSNAFGEYATGTADPVDVMVTIAKYGFNPKDSMMSLKNGVLSVFDAVLEPSSLSDFDVKVANVRTGQFIADANVVLIAPNEEFSFDYKTGANGAVSISNFLGGKYEVVAGKWGFITNKRDVVIDMNTREIIVPVEPGYYDDFAFDNSWTVSGDAVRGGWEWGEPVGTIMFDDFQSNPEFDLDNDFGPYCYVTGNGGGEFFEDDVDDGTTILTSPVMDLSSYQVPTLDFSWWFFNFDANSTSPGNDYYRVEASDDNQNWVTVFESTTAWANSWKTQEGILLSDYFSTFNSTMYVRFVTADDEPGNIVEAAVDRFFLYDAATVSNEPEIAQSEIKMGTRSGEIRLSYESAWDHASFSVMDMAGRKVHAGRLDNSQTTISLEHLPTGLFIIDVNGKDGQQFVKKFFNNQK